MRLLLAIAVCTTGLGSACTDAASDESSTEAPAADGPTYYRDIAPIVAANCVECHHSRGVAPFPLTTYGEVAPRAEAIAAATAARSMPPSNLDNSGACHTFVDARWLDDEDLAVIDAWAQAGAPAGEPTNEPVAGPPEWRLDRVDLTLEMPEPYTPDDSSEDDYRCFVLDPGLSEDVFVTGFEVRLGRPEMVHHLTLFALDLPEDDAYAEELDAADDGPGYTCFGDTVVPARWVAGAGPSDRGSLLPEGTGMFMGAGRKAVLQMHYNRHHGVAPDRTAIDLKLAPDVPRELFLERVGDTDLELAPGRPAVVETDWLEVEDDATLWGVWPHMHNLGTKMKVTVSHAMHEECLAQVDRYQFHWQRFALYERPIAVHAGDILRIACTYDTTDRETTTRWGTGTADEMCFAFLYITEGLPGAAR